MDALIINLKNKIEKLVTTIADPLSLITPSRMGKIDQIKDKQDQYVDATVSSRASQSSLTNVSAKVDGLVEKTVGRIVTTEIGDIRQGIRYYNDSLLIVGQSRIRYLSAYLRETDSGKTMFNIIVDGNIIGNKMAYSIADFVNNAVAFGITANESFEIICTKMPSRGGVDLTVQYTLEEQ